MNPAEVRSQESTKTDGGGVSRAWERYMPALVGILVFAVLRGLTTWIPALRLIGNIEFNIQLQVIVSLASCCAVLMWKQHRSEFQWREKLSDRAQEIEGLLQARQHLSEVTQQQSSELTSALEALEAATRNQQWTERAIAEQEKRQRAWMDQASDGIFIADCNGRVVESNRRLRELLEISDQGDTFENVFTHLFDATEESYHAFQQALQNGRTAIVTHDVQHSDGSTIHTEINARAMQDGHIVGIIRDITARKRAEEALRERELWYRTMFETASDAMFLMEGDQFIDCNAMTLKMFRCERDQIVGQPPYRFSPANQPDGQDSRSKARDYIRRALNGERMFFEWQHTRYDDTRFDAEVSLTNVQLQGKNYIFAMVRDVTERRRMEASLRESEIRSRTMVETSRDAIVAVDVEGHISVFNPAAQEMFGVSAADIIGAPVEAIVPSEFLNQHREAFNRLLKTGVASALPDSVMELEAVRSDGSRFPIEMTLALCHDTPSMRLVANIREITDQRQSSAAKGGLEQFQTMEAVGNLAGGIAHDFNNILTAIMGYGEFLQMQMEPGEKFRSEVDEILRAAERASSLTRQLLAFSQRQIMQLQPVNLSKVITGLRKMLEPLIGKDIRLELDMAADLDKINADPGQLEQVITNLVVNARDSMPEGGGIVLSTARVEVDEHAAARHAGVQPGCYVVLTVKDTGAGMAPELMARIFEPFFTTKENGTGTGLGLSTVYGIVKQFGGYIDVDSEIDRGTEVTIYLPVREEQPRAETDTHDTSEAVRSGTKTILLAEDDTSVRNLAVKILSNNGYHVLAGASPEEVKRIASDYSGRIDLLLTDVVMPGGSGIELARQLTNGQPNLPVLYMSGYNDVMAGNDGMTSSARHFLQKPFTAASLLSAIRRALASQPAPR